MLFFWMNRACSSCLSHNSKFCGLKAAGLVMAGLPEAAPEAGEAVLEILRNAPDSNAPLAQEGFKLLAALLRSCTSYKVWPPSLSCSVLA